MSDAYDINSDLVEKIHDSVYEVVSELRFDKKHAWHFTLLCLHATMIETAGSVHVLIRSKSFIGVPILLRSLLEAYLDITNLLMDRGYGYTIQLSGAHQWVRMLKEASQPGNPFLVELHNHPDRAKILSDFQAEMDQLKKAGHKTLSIKEKFEIVKLDPLYSSIYNALCCYSHNNQRALVSRHVKLSADLTDFELRLYGEPDFERIVPYIFTTCELLLRSTEALHLKLKGSVCNMLVDARALLDERRNALQS